MLWDNYFLDLPALLLRRKELYLPAMTHNPYQLLPFAPRYDGVLGTRDPADGYELVRQDNKVVAKLRVVGVLQAGVHFS